MQGNAATTVKNLIIDSSCTIHGYNRVGGITGSYQNGGSTITIENVVNEATIIAEHQDAGGIFGGHQSGGPTIIIRNVLNTGTITAKNEHPYAGALCCYMEVGGGSKIENFINLGTVNGHEGGNIGRHNIGDVTNLIDLSDTTDKTQGVVDDLTSADVTSGKVCYLMNGNTCYNPNWTQTLGTDSYPMPFNTQGFVNHISSAGYTTQYIPTTDVTIPTGIEAYAGVVNKNKSAISLVVIEDAISKEDAVVLKGSEGYYSFVPTTGVTPAAINNLNGSDGTATGGDGIYALSKQSDVVGFYPVGDGITIPAGKAYLNTGVLVKAFTFIFDDDDATSINEELRVKDEESGAAIYNVAGQMVNGKSVNAKLPKGIYIVNGKKVMVK